MRKSAKSPFVAINKMKKLLILICALLIVSLIFLIRYQLLWELESKRSEVLLGLLENIKTSDINRSAIKVGNLMDDDIANSILIDGQSKPVAIYSKGSHVIIIFDDDVGGVSVRKLEFRK